MSGSSTRRRGKDQRRRSRAQDQGFIHAKAGERSAATTRCGCCKVHPREGGGKGYGRPEPRVSSGSSTRRRGKARGLLGRAQKQGFIHAKAGERLVFLNIGTDYGVHPRERGGKVELLSTPIRSRGSSPRRQGEGKTVAHRAARNGTGSSTRKRGKAVSHPGRHLRLGFIHAKAGERRFRGLIQHNVGGHPREGGGKIGQPGRCNDAGGSPTQRRGKDLVRTRRPLRSRFIHAKAGERVLDVLNLALVAVHPRECGAVQVLKEFIQ